MTWSVRLRRFAVETIAFFAVACVVFYFATGRESVMGAIYTGAIATLFYGVITYFLRQRAQRR
jgi:hypothetical protein